jgi:hypothetical protein
VVENAVAVDAANALQTAYHAGRRVSSESELKSKGLV